MSSQVHANPIQSSLNKKEDNHAVAGINLDEVAVIAHLKLLNAKKHKTAVNGFEIEMSLFNVSRHTSATVVDGGLH